MFNRKLIVLAGAFALAAPAFAQGVGPVSSPVGAGKFFLGATVSFADNEWEDSDCPANTTCTDTDIQENHLALKGGYAFSDNWVGYAKLGMANSKVNETSPSPDFKFGSAPMVGVGVKGRVYSNGAFSTGPSFSYTWFAAQDDGLGGGTEITLESHWDATLAWGFEWKNDQIAVYGGPQLYKTEASVSLDGGICANGACGPDFDIENASNVGAYAGIGFAPSEKWRIGLELAHRAGLTATVGVAYAW